MKTFNPMQYMAIDIANHYGLDKLNYEDRITWVKHNIDTLEQLSNKADEPLLYNKAVYALRQAQQGKPINHSVAFDAVCSGLQLMSVVMRCENGARLTGLIDIDKRIDAYTEITKAMNEKLGSNLQVKREDAKKAIMTSLYGSVATPRDIFGEEKLPMYYQTLNELCGGAMELLQALKDSWDSNTDEVIWVLPDNHTAYCPVVQDIEQRINITEGLLNYTTTITYKDKKPSEYDISNIANVVHSLDAYVLRSVYRRCNYHKGKLMAFMRLIHNPKQVDNSHWITKRYKDTQIADIAWIDYIDQSNINQLPNELIHALKQIVQDVLEHEAFEVITIHDSFACHPNHMNTLRKHYNNVLADLSDSTVIDDILSQLYGEKGYINKGKSISELIRNSNYGLT